MNIEDLIHGESKNIEYKEMLPSNSENIRKQLLLLPILRAEKLFLV